MNPKFGLIPNLTFLEGKIGGTVMFLVAFAIMLNNCGESRAWLLPAYIFAFVLLWSVREAPPLKSVLDYRLRYTKEDGYFYERTKMEEEGQNGEVDSPPL